MRPRVALQRRFDVSSHRVVERRDLAGDVNRRRCSRLGSFGRSGSQADRRADAQCRGEFQRIAVAQNRRPVDHRAQLANIAGPVVALQQLDVGVARHDRRQAEADRGPLGKVPGQRRNVFDAIAQRRQQDRKHGDAIPQVFAERAFADHRRPGRDASRPRRAH